MDLITQNLPEALLIIGLILLVVEVLVLGFSTFFLFFVGLGFIFTGLVFFTGLIENNLINALISLAVVSGLSAAFLWKPLKRMQNVVDTDQVENDLIGYQFQLPGPLSSKTTLKHQYSGISWQISSDQAIAAGEQVQVIAVSVGKMKVKLLAANKD